MKPQRGCRKMVVEGQTWWWLFKGRNCVLWPPSPGLDPGKHGRKAFVDTMALTGRWPEAFDRGQWKRTTDGMITPGMVRDYILAVQAGDLSLCYTPIEANGQGLVLLNQKYPGRLNPGIAAELEEEKKHGANTFLVAKVQPPT